MIDTVFELRNYLLHPGQRDTLIALFEREFIESQEAVGAHVLGTFRAPDSPDHFVWLRSFQDMDTRAAALNAFYTGPVWRAHSAAANATMIDSDNVHLLRNAGTTLRIPVARAPIGATALSPRMYVADIYSLREGGDALASHAAQDPQVVATFATENTPNNFPALPVREEIVFVALRCFGRVDWPAPIPGMPAPQQTLRLQPTARSLLR